MPEAYSKEFRRDVLRDCDAGLGTQAVALKHNVSESWVRRCKQQRRETGQVEARKTRECKAGWHDWADWREHPVSATLFTRSQSGLPKKMANLAFSKFKKLLRDGAERTVDKLWTLCGRVLDLFPPHECEAYMRHCGCAFA